MSSGDVRHRAGGGYPILAPMASFSAVEVRDGSAPGVGFNERLGELTGVLVA